MLLFKKKFLDDIRTGRKTQTIRVWKVRHMRAGQLSYIPGVGYIRVDSVDEVALNDLTDKTPFPMAFYQSRSYARRSRGFIAATNYAPIGSSAFAFTFCLRMSSGKSENNGGPVAKAPGARISECPAG